MRRILSLLVPFFTTERPTWLPPTTALLVFFLGARRFFPSPLVMDPKPLSKAGPVALALTTYVNTLPQFFVRTP